ncbi:hypothetical protein GCM10012284_45710 [Mangrovihabitans endophyticus]|uniref:Uncharacterized protein n=1 Tax=Mangrovihabitans endophyticus TaxID=1751298 RepID=A0A8J3FQ22_9ACTN|nr:hypothetical protein GCM10012284_45710 [Mangrovihabitans endophyticus]
MALAGSAARAIGMPSLAWARRSARDRSGPGMSHRQAGPARSRPFGASRPFGTLSFFDALPGSFGASRSFDALPSASILGFVCHSTFAVSDGAPRRVRWHGSRRPSCLLCRL